MSKLTMKTGSAVFRMRFKSNGKMRMYLSKREIFYKNVGMKTVILGLKKLKQQFYSHPAIVLPAQKPEEQIFTVCLKRGGEAIFKGLHYIIQKSWAQGVLPEAFMVDPKVMLPKPGKTNYNTARSYRPITLESVIGKVMERVICNRLI